MNAQKVLLRAELMLNVGTQLGALSACATMARFQQLTKMTHIGAVPNLINSKVAQKWPL